MKTLSLILILIAITGSSLAQKQIKFNGQSITINGELISTHHYIKNDVDDGKKEIYSYYDEEIKILIITVLETDKSSNIVSLLIYYINLNFLNKGSSYVIERTNEMYKIKTIYAAKIALTDGKVINVKSMNRGDATWTHSNDPIAQIYFNNKTEAEKFIANIIK